MVPIADQNPRDHLESEAGQDARVSLGDVLETDRGELDAGLNPGGLSRTRLSSLEVRDGLERSIWVASASRC